MKQLLVEIDDSLARRLEEVAPSKKRQRSEFLRMAIVKAIMAEEEGRTEEAYRRQPDDPGDTYVDEREWDAPGPAPRRRRGR